MLTYRVFALLILAMVSVLESFRPGNEYFEGSITYRMSVSGSDRKFCEKIKQELGDKTVFWFKGGDYKEELNNATASVEYYDHRKYLSYRTSAGSDTFVVNDMTVTADSLIDVAVKKNVKKIKGYRCDEIIAHLKKRGKYDMTVSMFYDEKACPVNPEWFRLARTDALNVLYSHMKSLPLEMNIEFNMGTISMTAEKISPQRLDASIVHLPAGAILKGDKD